MAQQNFDIVGIQYHLETTGFFHPDPLLYGTKVLCKTLASQQTLRLPTLISLIYLKHIA